MRPLYLISVLLVIAVTACGGGAPTASSSAKSQLPPEWDQLVAAAKKEGGITIGLGPDPPLQQKVFPLFQQQFGIPVQTVNQNSGQLANKLIEERAAGVHSVDVLMASCNVVASTSYPAGLYAPLKPQLILPDVNDSSKWIDGKPWWVDREETYVLRLDRQVRYFFNINPDAVDATKLKTPQDILNPEWKGKIASLDPTTGNIGQIFAGLMIKLMGEDYVRQLYLGQGVKSTTEQRVLDDWLAHNTYPIAIGMPANERSDMKSAGLPISVLKLEGPISATLGSGLQVGVIADAPHPNAAKLFANWMLTQPTMQAMVDAEGTATVRTDMNYSGVDPDLIPQAGGNYFNECDWDYNATERPRLNDKLLQILRP